MTRIEILHSSIHSINIYSVLIICQEYHFRPWGDKNIYHSQFHGGASLHSIEGR